MPPDVPNRSPPEPELPEPGSKPTSDSAPGSDPEQSVESYYCTTSGPHVTDNDGY